MKLIVASNNKNKISEIKTMFYGLYEEILTLDEAGIFSEPEENGVSFEENALIKANAVFDKLKETNIYREYAVLSDDSGLCVDALGGLPGIHSARFYSLNFDASTISVNAHGEAEALQKKRPELSLTSCNDTIGRNASGGSQLVRNIEKNYSSKLSDVSNCILTEGINYDTSLKKAEIYSTFAKENCNGNLCSEIFSIKNSDNALNKKKLLNIMLNEKNRSARFVCALALITANETIVSLGECKGEILYKETGEGGFGYDNIFLSHDLNKSFGEASGQEKDRVSHRYRALRALAEKLSKKI